MFVVGTVRSGTTLLATAAGGRANVAYVGFELVEEWCRLADIAMATPASGRKDCPALEAADATRRRRQRVRRGLAARLAAEAPGGGVRFVSKNPHLWNKLPFLRAIFPDAALVVISRDVRSTVASVKALWSRQATLHGRRYHVPEDPTQCYRIIPVEEAAVADPGRVFPGGRVSVLAEYWLRTYEAIERELAGFDAALVVRHRDLVTAPDTIFSQLDGFLGAPPAPRPGLRLDRTRNDRWRELLSSAETDDLEAFLGLHRERIRRLQCADTSL